MAKDVAQRAVMWKLARVVPVIGVVVSAFYVARRMREKGVLRGGADSALDMTPIVGRLKALYETFAGDVIAPKRERTVTPEAAAVG